jgi:hypothetical protein
MRGDHVTGKREDSEKLRSSYGTNREIRMHHRREKTITDAKKLRPHP